MNKTLTIIGTASAFILTSGWSFAQSTGGPETMPPEVEERPELPDETKDLIADYRTEQEAIREERRAAVAAYLEENPEATADEVRAVIEDFNEANAERLEAQAEARAEIRDDLAELAPEVPVETQEKIDEYNANAQVLRDGRKAAVDALLEENPEATPEEIREVVRTYNADNIEAIQAQAELRRDIKTDIADLRPGPTPLERRRDGVEMRVRKAAVRAVAAEMKDEREETRALLEEATDREEKEQILADFREARRATIAELTAELKAEAEERRNARESGE